MPKENFTISDTDKELIVSILQKIDKPENPRLRIVSFEELNKQLSEDEIDLVNKYLKINPLEHGFRGQYFGIQNVPEDLEEIADQKYKEDKIIPTQYLPKQVNLAYKKLNDQLHKDTGRKLLIDSGYRSPAYQIVLFLRFLNLYEFDFEKTVKRVAIPGYSEHGFAKGQAVDFFTVDGIPNKENPMDFEETVEFKWLLENANRFGFFLSYPRDNKFGIMYEPWHWHFEQVSNT